MPDVKCECPVCGGEMKDVRTNTKQCVACGAVRRFEPEVVTGTREESPAAADKPITYNIEPILRGRGADAPEDPPLTTAATVLEGVSADVAAKLHDVESMSVGHVSVTVAPGEPEDDEASPEQKAKEAALEERAADLNLSECSDGEHPQDEEPEDDEASPDQKGERIGDLEPAPHGGYLSDGALMPDTDEPAADEDDAE